MTYFSKLKSVQKITMKLFIPASTVYFDSVNKNCHRSETLNDCTVENSLCLEIIPNSQRNDIEAINGKIIFGERVVAISLCDLFPLYENLCGSGCNLLENLEQIISLMLPQERQIICNGYCELYGISDCNQRQQLIEIFVIGISIYLTQIFIFLNYQEFYPFGIEVVGSIEDLTILSKCSFAYMRPYLTVIISSDLALFSTFALNALNFLEAWIPYFVPGCEIAGQMERSYLFALEGYGKFAIARIYRATSNKALECYREKLCIENQEFLNCQAQLINNTLGLQIKEFGEIVCGYKAQIDRAYCEAVDYAMGQIRCQTTKMTADIIDAGICEVRNFVETCDKSRLINICREGQECAHQKKNCKLQRKISILEKRLERLEKALNIPHELEENNECNPSSVEVTSQISETVSPPETPHEISFHVCSGDVKIQEDLSKKLPKRIIRTQTLE